jgi:hypothetical protein
MEEELCEDRDRWRGVVVRQHIQSGALGRKTRTRRNKIQNQDIRQLENTLQDKDTVEWTCGTYE